MNTLPNTSLVGNSESLQAIVNASHLIATTDVAILILGESGTGKELLAQSIHRHSRRADKPFISINCAALAENLAESELFGHRKGAFTGADTHYLGRLRAAHGGTVFLDEIGELALPIQAKLLRFLEAGECQPVGEAHPIKIDARIIAATNRDLAQEVKAGRFRADLFYRLNVVPFELPPLRQRRDDIPLLINHINQQLAVQYRTAAPRYSKAAMEVLRSYPWPGNVRELRNTCERLLVLLQGRDVDIANLPIEIRTPAQAAADASQNTLSLPDMEKNMIERALNETQGNRSRAARLLGITRDTLNYRLKKFSIN